MMCLLALSGKEGLIIDIPRKRVGEEEEGDLANEHARIRMPPELSAQDVLKRIEALTPALRRSCRGIIPTYKGYAVRVIKQSEAEVTRILSPGEAEIQGPSLGMEINSSWVVRGIPNHVTKSQITAAFAQQNGEGWPGWLIRPRKTLHTDKVGTTAWLVDAASELPLRAMAINRSFMSTFFQ